MSDCLFLVCLILALCVELKQSLVCFCVADDVDMADVADPIVAGQMEVDKSKDNGGKSRSSKGRSRGQAADPQEAGTDNQQPAGKQQQQQQGQGVDVDNTQQDTTRGPAPANQVCTVQVKPAGRRGRSAGKIADTEQPTVTAEGTLCAKAAKGEGDDHQQDNMDTDHKPAADEQGADDAAAAVDGDGVVVVGTADRAKRRLSCGQHARPLLQVSAGTAIGAAVRASVDAANVTRVGCCFCLHIHWSHTDTRNGQLLPSANCG